MNTCTGFVNSKDLIEDNGDFREKNVKKKISQQKRVSC